MWWKKEYPNIRSFSLRLEKSMQKKNVSIEERSLEQIVLLKYLYQNWTLPLPTGTRSWSSTNLCCSYNISWILGDHLGLAIFAPKSTIIIFHIPLYYQSQICHWPLNFGGYFPCQFYFYPRSSVAITSVPRKRRWSSSSSKRKSGDNDHYHPLRLICKGTWQHSVYSPLLSIHDQAGYIRYFTMAACTRRETEPVSCATSALRLWCWRCKR